MLQPVKEARPPFWMTEGDYNVMYQGKPVGRISFDHKPYANEAHVRAGWFLNDAQRNRMADDRCATREKRWRPSAARSIPWRTVEKSA